MSRHEFLSLVYQLELSHSAHPHPGGLMRLLCSIVLILLGTVNGCRNQPSMRYAITSEFIRNDLSGFSAMNKQ